jgi:NTP pyrophosphatase (non-canonical NTP hydrolase)
MTFADLEMKVVRWAEARGIIQNSNIQAQARKTLEEAGELLEAAAAMRAVGIFTEEQDEYRSEYRKEMGDVLVTLIIGAATADVDLTECLSEAYEKIKTRTGYLKPDGTFVKQPEKQV